MYILNLLPARKINKCTHTDKRKQTGKTALWALGAIICIEKILTGLNGWQMVVLVTMKSMQWLQMYKRYFHIIKMLLKANDTKAGCFGLWWDITSRLQYEGWGEIANSGPYVTNCGWPGSAHRSAVLTSWPAAGWKQVGATRNQHKVQEWWLPSWRILCVCALSSLDKDTDLTKRMCMKHTIMATPTLALHAGSSWPSCLWLAMRSPQRSSVPSLATCTVCYT